MEETVVERSSSPRAPRRFAVLRAVLQALFDPGPQAQASIAPTIAEIRAYLARAGLQTRLAFRAALLAVQFSPLLTLGALRRFVGLDAADRARCLARLERSRLGLAVVLLKTVLCLHWFDRPEVLARTGYDGSGPAWAGGPSVPAPRLPILPGHTAEVR